MVPAGTATSGRALRGRVSAVLRLSSGIQSGILCEMHSWGDFAAARPDLAAKGRSLLYMPGRIGLGFLATTREDGGPRVHPICPLLTDDGLYAFIVPGPKLEDLHRDGRYALHSETFPPPHHDDAFYVTGTAVLVEDPVLRGTLTNLFLVERDLVIPWDGFEDQDLFELRFDRCLLTLTEPEGDFPAGHTLWRGRRVRPASAPPRRPTASTNAARCAGPGSVRAAGAHPCAAPSARTRPLATRA